MTHRRVRIFAVLYIATMAVIAVAAVIGVMR